MKIALNDDILSDMAYPKVKFVSASEKEVKKYICFLAKSISNGNYQKAGFLILPYLEKGLSNLVHFPGLGYSVKFWRYISECKQINLGDEIPSEVLDLIRLNKEIAQKPSDLKIGIGFWRFIKSSNLFNFDKLNVKEINVKISDYGTIGSFYPRKNVIYINLRRDATIYDLTKLILLSLYKMSITKRAEVSEPSWYTRQNIVEFLLNNTGLFKIVGSKRHKLATPKNILDSKLFLDKLGFKKNMDFQSILSNNIFTTTEQKIITILHKNIGKVVTFDDLGDLVWDNDSEIFSLYSLSKHIQNIREKLGVLEINEELISTVRKKGYVMNI